MKKLLESSTGYSGRSDPSRNARERQRINVINEKFRDLKETLPKNFKHRKMSKLDILRKSISYIRHLQNILDGEDGFSNSINGPADILNFSNCRSTMRLPTQTITSDNGFDNCHPYRPEKQGHHMDVVDIQCWAGEILESDASGSSSSSPSMSRLGDPMFIFDTD